jgi:MFS transporter, UMF1 family
MKQVTVVGETSKGGKFGWAMFDWANQPFFTLITTFIFAPYFVSFVVGDAVRGQVLWGYTQSFAGVAIALAAPFLGSIADAGGRRKPWIGMFTALGVIASCALWYATPAADAGGLVLTMAMIVVATIAVEFAIVFNNAMLPSLTGERHIGMLSGFGWGLGYVGGLIALVIVLLGFSLPEVPLFGIDKAAHEHDRLVGPLSGLWFAVFVIPLFVLTPDTASRGLRPLAAVRLGVGTLLETLRALPRYRNIALYLVARMFYYDGQSAIFAFGGIYAAGLFGWTTTELGLFGIILIVFAAVGAFVGGWLDDRLGSKRFIALAVVGLILSTLGVVSISDGRAFFFMDVGMPSPGSGLFASEAERIFLAITVVLALCGGPAQAASRTMLARLAPDAMMGEFFGLYALSGKATAFMAPLAVAVLTDAFQSQRAGISVVLVFLVVGFGLLVFVKEERAPALH